MVRQLFPIRPATCDDGRVRTEPATARRARPVPQESRVKTLFKLVVLAVLALAVVGAWKDWYTFSTRKAENGNRLVTIEFNDGKMKSDLAIVKASSRDAVDHALGDDPATPEVEQPANGAKTGAATKADPKVRDLETKRNELASQLEHLKKVPGAKIDAALHVIQQKIDDYDRQIEALQGGH
jgi:hypothetical protein